VKFLQFPCRWETLFHMVRSMSGRSRRREIYLPKAVSLQDPYQNIIELRAQSCQQLPFQFPHAITYTQSASSSSLFLGYCVSFVSASCSSFVRSHFRTSISTVALVRSRCNRTRCQVSEERRCCQGLFQQWRQLRVLGPRGRIRSNSLAGGAEDLRVRQNVDHG
jgi:hypothetical protein